MLAVSLHTRLARRTRTIAGPKDSIVLENLWCMVPVQVAHLIFVLAHHNAAVVRALRRCADDDATCWQRFGRKNVHSCFRGMSRPGFLIRNPLIGCTNEPHGSVDSSKPSFNLHSKPPATIMAPKFDLSTPKGLGGFNGFMTSRSYVEGYAYSQVGFASNISI